MQAPAGLSLFITAKPNRRWRLAKHELAGPAEQADSVGSDAVAW